MHDIEPHFGWREHYESSDDELSPFNGQEYDQFSYSNKVYNYFVHPQWDDIGSETLYAKIIYADYDESFAIIELIGEWNDCLHNDIMSLKRNVIDVLSKNYINKYIIMCDNVMNYHASDDAYYEEWYEDAIEDGGWICFVNLRDHILDEMNQAQVHFYVNLGESYNEMFWQKKKPKNIVIELEAIMSKTQKILH